MSDGNIRIMAESPGIDLGTEIEPTASQYNTISRFIKDSAKNKYFFVDFTDSKGNVIGSLEYDGILSADEILYDIKDYFKNGTIRNQSKEYVQYSLPSIDRYTEKQYNNFGWVATSGILSGKELKQLYSQFANIKLLSHKYPKTKQGENIIITGKKYGDIDNIVFIKGTNKHPIVTKIYSFIGLNQQDREISANEVAEYEQSGYDNANEIVEAYAGHSVFRRYTLQDCISYSEYKKQRHKLSGDENSKKRNFRAGSNDENISTLADSVDEPAYSLPNDNYAPTFYSKMGKTVDEMKQDKIGANSVVSYLTGRGVKSEEIKWSGIETFLEGKKSVTKAELQEFIAGSQLQIEENVRDDRRNGIKVKRVSKNVAEAYVNDKLISTFTKKENGWWQSDKDSYLSAGSFHDIKRAATTLLETDTKWSEYTLEGGKNYREITFKMPTSTYSNGAMRGHWGDNAKGIIAHARIQDFKVDGKKMLFIEEIQSDWHNAGHKHGYSDEKLIHKYSQTEAEVKDQISTDPKMKKFVNAMGLNSMMRRLRAHAVTPNRSGEYVWEDFNYEAKILFNKEATKDALIDYYSRIREGITEKEKAPDAPFKDNYHEYVIKSLLRTAAENGYDSIGWTPADVQSERWSDEFAEGYRIEYDQDMPKFLKKYGKQWGATVGSTVLNNGTEVWSMDITDQMKNSVLYEGQSLYSLPDDGIPKIARGKSYKELDALVKEGKITSDEAFKALGEENGTMPKGERPKVDVNVPEKVSKTKNVNQFMRNVLESGHLDANMTEREKRNIISGARTYNPISDKAALDKAEKKIKADVNGAVQEWENAINGNRRITKYEIALGEQLLVQAAETGNANDVTRYVAELAELGTQLGQDIQALRLLKQMTGMGQLYYVTRAVARLNKDIESRYGEKHKIVEIDPNLANILANAKSEAEVDDVVKDLIKDVASQVESSWVDKFNSWRYLAMLGNPRTHFRNIVGNAVFMPAVGTKNKIAAIMETMFVDKENRTKTFGFLKPEYRDFATEDFKKVEEIIKGGGKMNPADQIRDQMKVYNSKAFAWLEGVRQFNFNALETEDGWFLKGHYIRAFGGAMQARGLDVNNIKP
ncbi:MAG: hypothetical protein U0L88_13035, partial [Acutalibacteraceae bacterium]|nr:hypothetical protein [Acutalibacteraceae bacterium]